jgi:hypothetical protein
LQFGGAEKSSSAITLQNSTTIFRHAVCEQFKVLSACFSPKARCASFYFERSCPEQYPRAALKP